LFFVFIGQVSAQVTGLSGWNIFLDPGHRPKRKYGNLWLF